jgi:hypothetical protein
MNKTQTMYSHFCQYFDLQILVNNAPNMDRPNKDYEYCTRVLKSQGSMIKHTLLENSYKSSE